MNATGLSRGIAFSAGFVVLALLSMASPIARTLGGEPARWASLPFVDPAAFVARADRQLGAQGSPGRTPEAAAQLARATLRSHPIQPAAVRILAVSARNPGQARALMDLSAWLGRRDLVTTLWRIETAAQANDLKGVLAGYDIAMRTGFDSWSLLFERLGGGLSEPTIRRGLETYLARRPLWRDAFLDYALLQPPLHGDLARLFIESRALGDDAGLAQRRASLSRMLVEANRFADARALYIAGSGADRRLLVSPAISARALRPESGGLGWLLIEGADGAATETTGTEGRPALALVARPDRGPVLARKILFLAPGSYRISARGDGGAAIGPVRLTVRCAAVGGMRPVATAAPASDRATRMDASFIFAADCPVQQVDLQLRGAPGQADTTSIIAAIDLAVAR